MKDKRVAAMEQPSGSTQSAADCCSLPAAYLLDSLLRKVALYLSPSALEIGTPRPPTSRHTVAVLWGRCVRP